MEAKSQRTKGPDGALSSLNLAIEALDLAKNAMGMKPAEDMFSSASALLATIRDSTIDKADCVELGLACADICQSVLKSIGELTTVVAEIQKHIVERGKRNALCRLFHAKGDAKAIADRRMDLERIRSDLDSGRIRSSSECKPLELSLREVGRYVPPIGVVRLWLRKAMDHGNIEATLGGKHCSYVRVLVDDVTKARTNTANNDLDPVWNQIIYIPVHSLREILFLECMDHKRAHKDRSLGYVELHLNELSIEADSKEYPYESTGKKVAVAHLKFEKGISSWQLHYEAEFFPAPALKDLKFSTGGITSRGPLGAMGKENCKGIGHPALDKSDANSPIELQVESIGKNASGMGAVVSKEELAQHRSGVIVFEVTTAQLTREARLEVFLDDECWPAFTTSTARSRNATWGYTGEGFIKELDSGCVWLRLNDGDEGAEDNVIAVSKEDAKQFLQEAMDGTVKRTLFDQDGKSMATVELEALYIPVRLKTEPGESIDSGRNLWLSKHDTKTNFDQGIPQVRSLVGIVFRGADPRAEVLHTNSPPNSQVALRSSLKSDQLNNGDPDAISKALDDRFNELFLPQDKAPPSPINGVCIPQRKYDKGTGRDDPKNQGRVVFIREDGTYLPVKEALEKRYGSLMDQDLPVLDEAGLTVMVRFEWPGYQSKEYQMRVVDWRGEPQKIPLPKLATEIAKIVNKFVGDMQGKSIDPNYAMWRVGQDAIRVGDLRLAAFEQVSAGSWQIRLFYMRSH